MAFLRSQAQLLAFDGSLNTAQEGSPRGADQTGVLDLPPAFASAMNTVPVARLAGRDASPVSFEDFQVGETFGVVGQGVVTLGVGVRKHHQSTADVMDDRLDCPGGYSLAGYPIHEFRGLLERPCLGGRDGGPLHLERGQFLRCQSPTLPAGGKVPTAVGTRSQLLESRRLCIQELSPSVRAEHPPEHLVDGNLRRNPHVHHLTFPCLEAWWKSLRCTRVFHRHWPGVASFLGLGMMRRRPANTSRQRVRGRHG